MNVNFIGPPDGLVEPTDDSAAVTSSVACNRRHPDAFRGDILADVTAREEESSAIVSKGTEDINGVKGDRYKLLYVPTLLSSSPLPHFHFNFLWRIVTTRRIENGW